MQQEDKTDPNQRNSGLYVPQAERDACGVGLIAKLTNEPSRYIVDAALRMLESMEHRGASGCETNTGDGAGILMRLPHNFFVKRLKEEGIHLPEFGRYGVGMFFLPKEKAARKVCRQVIRQKAEKWGIEPIYIRRVPVDNSSLGNTAIGAEPIIEQWFFDVGKLPLEKTERQFYIFRSSVMKKVYDTYPTLTDDFYIASLSSKTIVYKGLLTATQLRQYFLDLQDLDFTSSVAVIHSRFSTNTIPKWKLAQPFRNIAHNGEINTIQGNINWWIAGERHLDKSEIPEIKHITPLCDPYLSDSGNFDNVVDFLLNFSNRSIPHSLMMMIPEAWQNDDNMPAYKKAFYQYHEAILEPWEGPASICFTDGTLVGAILDRNGLRPSRYLVTSDDLLVVASEAGTIPIRPETIVYKGRLEPGKILVADLEKGCIISDEEVKRTICQRKPYAKWLDENAVQIEDLPDKKTTPEKRLPLRQQQLAFGLSLEDEKLILSAMMENAKEPLGSMGTDIPLAILSKKNQHPANYFKQQFAQVTNPPIDSLREKYYMSLSTVIGGGSQILHPGAEQACVIRTDSPILTRQMLANITLTENPAFRSTTINATYKKGASMEDAIEDICQKAIRRVNRGNRILVLTNRNISVDICPIPTLLIAGAVHHRLIEKGLRKETALVIDAGDVWETHHAAILLSYGADLICPYIAFSSVVALAKKKNIAPSTAKNNYRKALEKGILKIMSKLGIATLASYKGAQTFEALGIAAEVIDKCFKGTVSRIGGMGFSDLQKENELRHDAAFENRKNSLPHQGVYQWRRTGEYHLFNPSTIHLLQYSTSTNQYSVYKQFAEEIDDLEKNGATLRSFIRIKKNSNSIPIEEVESRSSILKRFASGAMSFGSISHEAHTTLAIAMNRIGGKSNSGEGGEDSARFVPLPNGDSMRSAIKQVASGRFGVNINYLTNADELQIKIAQGAKPGEGGQLPGHKVNETIAQVRNSTPGVGLISPPPHHDIYSIEDLAQLIFDLKNANRKARIGVKLVAKSGVGVIASGVTKAHADHILISGYDGGTGASPLSSVRHAGIPWEIGLSETHQTLIKNGLRDRVVLQADGQIRTGRDLAIATMLGAEEWGIATAALVVQGCVLMRKCHSNTCPVGIATQDEKLRNKFTGKVEHIINYFHFLADHLREIMASLGVKTVNELVGRTDLLEIRGTEKHWKTQTLDLSPLLFRQPNMYNNTNYATKKQNHGLQSVLDRKLITQARQEIASNTKFTGLLSISSTDRTTGAILSNEITKRYGEAGMPEGSLRFHFTGSAGQSFGAFGARGIFFHLEGEANDYFGKGLSGAVLAVNPPQKTVFDPAQNVIIGNVALYGATAGEAYINGRAGDRFCVRNSGATAVVEGIGANGCEYMTGGTAVILGPVGQNFAAGMSGGIAYLYRHLPENNYLLNREMILLETPTAADLEHISALIERHLERTGSPRARYILDNWEKEKRLFTKVFPIEYKRALEQKGSNQTKHKGRNGIKFDRLWEPAS